MRRGYNYVKESSFNSEESTRSILSNGIEQISSSSIAHLPKLTSVKRTIRKCKSVSEISCGNPTCAAEIQIPQKYKVTLKDEAFLLYDSGYGNNNRMIIFLLLNSFLFSKNQIPGLHLKLFRNISCNYILYTLKKDRFVFPCIFALLPNYLKLNQT